MTFLKDLEKRAREGLNAVQDAVADPRLIKVGEVAEGVMQIAAQVGQAKLGGPMAVVGAAMASMGVLQRVLDSKSDSPMWRRFRKLVASEGCIEVAAGQFRLLYEEGLLEGLNPQKVNELHFAIRDEKGRACYFSKHNAGCYLHPEFNSSHLGKMVLDKLGGPVMTLEVPPGGNGHHAMPRGAPYSTIPYVGEHDPRELATAVEVYRSRGVSRAYLISGPPGSGKSTFVAAYARATQQTLLICPTSILGSPQVIGQWLDILTPDILLLEDIDHSGHAPALLVPLTEWRRRFPRMVVCTTANDLSGTTAALLRPGRLGRRWVFGAPSIEDRKEVLRLYLDEYGVDASRLDIETLASAMTHPRFTHDYVRSIAEEAVVLDQEGLMKLIQETCLYLSTARDTHVPDHGEQPQPQSVFARLLRRD